MSNAPKKSHRVRCRSGDLALVIGELPGLEENIGRFVQVLRPATQWTRNNRLWRVQPVQATPWIVYSRETEASLQGSDNPQKRGKLNWVAVRKHAENITRDAMTPRMDQGYSEVCVHPVVTIDDKFLLPIRDNVLIGEPAPKRPPGEPLD